jgi:hypothetical protein
MRYPMTPLWRDAFLAALRLTGNVRGACDAVRISRQAAYTLRKADSAFAVEWDVAIKVGQIAAIHAQASAIIAVKTAAARGSRPDFEKGRRFFSQPALNHPSIKT